MWGSRFIVALFVLAGLAFIAGCGDSGDDGGADDGSAAAANGSQDASGNSNSGGTTSTTPGEGFSKEEFVNQANAVCAQRSAEVKVKGQRLFKEIYSEPEAVAAKKMANQVIIPAFEGELEDLQALNVPTGDGDQVRAIYAAIEEMVERLKANPADGEYYPYTEAENLAAKYGLTACGHP